MAVFCGIDWAEDHHDIALVDQDGTLLAKRRIGDDTAGFAALLQLLVEAGDDPEAPGDRPVGARAHGGLDAYEILIDKMLSVRRRGCPGLGRGFACRCGCSRRLALLDRKRERLLRLRHDGSIDDSVARR